MQTMTWCQNTELQSDLSEIQCANKASLEANSWLQPTSVNMKQFKPPSLLRLTGDLIIVYQYNTDYVSVSRNPLGGPGPHFGNHCSIPFITFSKGWLNAKWYWAHSKKNSYILMLVVIGFGVKVIMHPVTYVSVSVLLHLVAWVI